MKADPHVCATCGAHLPGDAPPPELCPICDEPRQYVPLSGQRWLSYRHLSDSHANRVEEVERDLWGVRIEPAFAIGQRALLVRTPEGNLLWDCVPLLDAAGSTRLEELGGVRAIAVSHPHFYAGVASFAETFGAEILLHAADRAHVTHPSPRMSFWDGETHASFGGLTLVRVGGHFAGGTVLHWPAGAAGRGALLTGDIVRVIPDRSHVAFLYSYPNLIPLPAREVERIRAAVATFRFDRIHDGWWDRVIETGAEEVLERSVTRYVRALAGRLDGAQLPWPGA